MKKKQVTNEKYPTREAWLLALSQELSNEFHELQNMPRYRVTCGWPSRGALAAKKRVIGQCFNDSCSDDKSYEIIISMVQFDGVEVAATMAHEMTHAVAGIEAGHRGEFARIARAIGLEGKLTATHAGQEFAERVEPILYKLGQYPHAKLDVSSALKKQGTRLIKCECPQCGYNVRTTRKWIYEIGLPHCPLHGEMEEA